MYCTVTLSVLASGTVADSAPDKSAKCFNTVMTQIHRATEKGVGFYGKHTEKPAVTDPSTSYDHCLKED